MIGIDCQVVGLCNNEHVFLIGPFKYLGSIWKASVDDGVRGIDFSHLKHLFQGDNVAYRILKHKVGYYSSQLSQNVTMPKA